MRRRRRRLRPPVVPREGDLVVDARVRARLLGVNLLDLDARVVVGTAGDESAASTPGTAAVARGRTARTGRAAAALTDGEADGPVPRPALRRAERLLGEGESALDDARRMRRRARGAMDGPREDGPP